MSSGWDAIDRVRLDLCTPHKNRVIRSGYGASHLDRLSGGQEQPTVNHVRPTYVG